MTSSPETSVVGTYVTEQEAQNARTRLHETGVESVDITRVPDDVRQVEVPSQHRQQALDETELMEQHNIADL